MGQRRRSRVCRGGEGLEFLRRLDIATVQCVDMDARGGVDLYFCNSVQICIVLAIQSRK